ncbi:hypothetical protein FQN54_002962 [Arachnomyces sp. PD_36]|nr:hypothetical protein FQN54_002962 [Arachnomyces sp. PD_36]
MPESRPLRSSKRRKVSDNKWAGSQARDESERDVFDVPSDSDEGRGRRRGKGRMNRNSKANRNSDDDGGQGDPFDVELEETPRRGTRKLKATVNVEEKPDDDGEDEDMDGQVEETPTRRSSARTRKPVQRLNAAATPGGKPTRRALFTPSNSGNKKEGRRGAESNGVEESGKRVPIRSALSSSKKRAEGPEEPQSARARRSSRSAVWEESSGSEYEPTSNKVKDRVPRIEGSPVPSEPVEEDGDDDIEITQQLQQSHVPEEEEPPIQTELLPGYAEELKALCQRKGLERHLGSLSSMVLEKLMGKRRIPLKGLEKEYQKVHQLIEHTVVSGEGNSMLLLGSRGCGKTTLVETALSSLKEEHGDDFYVVRLNGFVHTDDRIALREIWRQLGREMNVDDSLIKLNSYADTMASLLALLSHPEEIYGRPDDPDVIQTSKSVIIVLDEFDLFAYHSRQTLLYNLFDIAQAKKAPLAVLGVTTRLDVTDHLEKRVKSRYSHRFVFLPRPKNFGAFSEVCMAGLALARDELTADPMEHVHEGSDAALLMGKRGNRVMEGWEKFLQDLWQDSNFQTHLQQIYYTSKSPKDFYTSALLPLTTLHHSTYLPQKFQIPTPKTFITHSLSCPDPAPLPFPPIPAAATSTSTTSLPLSLLLAATRLTALHDPGLNSKSTTKPTALNLSFSIAYTEYVRLLTSAKASASASGATATAGRVWGRDVAREAWGKLVKWGILEPVGSGANSYEDGGGGGGGEDGKMYRAEVSFEEVVELVGVEGSLGRWWRDG